jgi:hypothetical protein
VTGLLDELPVPELVELDVLLEPQAATVSDSAAAAAIGSHLRVMGGSPLIAEFRPGRALGTPAGILLRPGGADVKTL